MDSSYAFFNFLDVRGQVLAHRHLLSDNHGKLEPHIQWHFGLIYVGNSPWLMGIVDGFKRKNQHQLSLADATGGLS